MLLLLAQLVAPPLQEGPVRLPAPGAGQQRPAPGREGEPPPVQVEPLPPETSPPARPPSPSGGAPPGGGATLPPPEVRGLTVYSAQEVREILAGCGAGVEADARLNACAAALGARLVADGYVNSRVYVQRSPEPGFLEVVEGKMVEVRVIGSDDRLNRRVQRLLAGLQGRILRLPDVERDLRLLQRQQGIGEVRGNLSRLGRDPSQAILTISVQPGRLPWQGDFSLRNDGSNGSGEWRGIASLFKPTLLTSGDSLLLYGEVNGTGGLRQGALITSLSYTLPVADNVNLTGAFGFSRRSPVELPSPSDEFTTNQIQGLGQVEWVFKESLSQRWSLFAGFSGDRSNTYFNGAALPDTVPASVRSPRNGYVRIGVAGSGIKGNVGLSGNGYLLQGIAAATPEGQRKELAAAGVDPGQATALGGIVSAGWQVAPRWQVNLRAAGQVAFQPLTSAMQFTLGSDVGLRGLPGQLVSGDSGWLGTAEVVWTAWRKGSQAVQVVPFIGAGGVRTNFPNTTFNDTVGSYGLLARWLPNNSWLAELGLVDQFSASDNAGAWTDWALGKGLYVKLQYSF